MGAPVQMEEVASGVHLVQGTETSWVLIEDSAGGREITLVDSGYPADLARVHASLGQIGRSAADVAALVLTHGHPDHLGGAERLRRENGIEVRVEEREAGHARGEWIEQISELAILRSAWRPRVAVWALRIVAAGGARVQRIEQVSPFRAEDGPLDVPGRPVPVPTPGHTRGHCSFHLPDLGVLIAGDALMTAHHVTRRTGPQLLPSDFNTDDEAALTSLESLAALQADVVLPGHGPPFRGSPAEAVRHARSLHR